MHYVTGDIAALTFFLSVDVDWIKAVTRPLFQRQVGEMLLDEPRRGAAAAFYTLYIAGVVYFSWSRR